MHRYIRASLSKIFEPRLLIARMLLSVLNCPPLREWNATHETNIWTNHWLLGCMVGMDSGWHGFVYLCAGVESGAVGAFAEVGIREDSGKCGAGGIDFVCTILGWLGAFIHVGADCRPFR